jgi:hypothetical protein
MTSGLVWIFQSRCNRTYSRLLGGDDAKSQRRRLAGAVSCRCAVDAASIRDLVPSPVTGKPAGVFRTRRCTLRAWAEGVGHRISGTEHGLDGPGRDGEEACGVHCEIAEGDLGIEEQPAYPSRCGCPGPGWNVADGQQPPAGRCLQRVSWRALRSLSRAPPRVAPSSLSRTRRARAAGTPPGWRPLVSRSRRGAPWAC